MHTAKTKRAAAARRAAAAFVLALSANGCEVLRPSEARPPTIWGHVFLDGEAQPDWPVIVDRRCVYTTVSGGWEVENVAGSFRAGDTVGVVRAVPAMDATVAPESYLDVVPPAGGLDFRYTTAPGKVAVGPTGCDLSP